MKRSREDEIRRIKNVMKTGSCFHMSCADCPMSRECQDSELPLAEVATIAKEWLRKQSPSSASSAGDNRYDDRSEGEFVLDLLAEAGDWISR